VIVVTGASSGIGAATARLAHRRGARLVLAARREERLRALAETLTNCLVVRTDVTKDDERHHLVDAAVREFGQVDVLVNNAGCGLHVPLEEVDLDAFREVFELNVIAPLALMQLVIPIMRAQGGGAIVNLSSQLSRTALPGVGAYAATKAALNILSETAREELAADGIVVSNVLPATTNTDFYLALRQATPRPDRAAMYAAGDSVEAVAAAVLDLAESGAAETVLLQHDR
jgi:short-subunit dehydrogenase